MVASSSNNNNTSTSMDDDFPTGRSVPFPFEPYPQQVDLMDAILESLRFLDTKNNDEDKPSSPTGVAAACTSSTTTKFPRQASVWMLESPTGTGKSLSLAASVISWLEYAEKQDLRVEEKDNNSNKDENATTTEKNNKEESWWDAWESPEERQTKKDLESVRTTARQSRNRLQKHLHHIQRQFIDTNSHTSNSNKNVSKQQLQQRQRSKRQTVVRMAITAAKQDDAFQRRVGYNKKRQRGQGPAEENKPNSTSKEDNEDDDFCLEDYKSDNDEKESLDFDHDSDNDDDKDRPGGKYQSTLSSKNGKPSAAILLDGASLDGSASLAASSSLPSTGPRMALSSTTTSTTSSTSPTIPTIGNVHPGSGVRKIIYCARTHSQLSQFTSEIRRQWPHIRVLALGGRKSLCGNAAINKKSEAIINEQCLDWQKNGGKNKCSSTKSTTSKSLTTSISKKRDSSSSSGCRSTGCPLLSSRAAVNELAVQLLAHPTDIEEAAALGQASQTCAYYASRQALAAAQVVVMPYSMLLSPATRQAIGLSLQSALVVMDEAHNLPEALRSLHSCRLTLRVIDQALEQLLNYTTRYQQRLANRNLFYLGRLRKILLTLKKHLTKPNPKVDGRGMLTPGELLIALKLDKINLFKILRYLEHSRLAQKLLGFTTAAAAAAAAAQQDDNKNHTSTTANDNHHQNGEYQSKHVSSMSIVQTFLEKLTTSGKEGKIVTDRPKATDIGEQQQQQQQQPALRYVLLQPAAFFENVLEEAHALALVGGTLRPFVHVAAELMGDKHDVLQQAALADEAIATQQSSSLSSSSSSAAKAVTPPSTKKQQVSYSFVSPTFTAFSCDHVVSSSNVLLQNFSTGPTGQLLDFRHASRSLPQVCNELGRTLLRICQTVPSGVVVFLPSYAYEASLVRQWRQSGIWQQLRDAKKVHREPKSSQQVDSTLSAYAKDASKGALLLSVVGGKMSEGINFADDMARCVVVVGLPYPDITNPELKEKMAAMDRAARVTSSNPGTIGGAGSTSTKTSITGQAYYHNLAMRAVNQSVGRAIRHANDYAAVVMVDARYGSDQRVWSSLPGWLKKGASKNWKSKSLPFEARLQEVQHFFAQRKVDE